MLALALLLTLTLAAATMNKYRAVLGTSRELVLASASPRRADILSKNIGLAFRVEVSTFKEDLDKAHFGTAVDYVCETARCKALDVLSRLSSDGRVFDGIVISADTIVSHQGRILEKPADLLEARAMLGKLSGSTHTVITAMTLASKSSAVSPTCRVFFEETVVKFASLTADDIDYYCATNEPYDKAGGYGYQSLGAQLVERIDGCYYNVVGLPVNRFCTEMAEFLKEVS